MVDIFPFWNKIQTLGRWNQHVDSQLPSLHLHFALSQPIYHKATLPLYLYLLTKLDSYRLDILTLCDYDEDWGYLRFMSNGGYFSILENFPNFREMKPTCRLPITKFSSTLCLKPSFISQGNITAVLHLITYMTHINLTFLLWCDEDWGYFYDLCQVVDIFPFWKNFQTLVRWNQPVDS